MLKSIVFAVLLTASASSFAWSQETNGAAASTMEFFFEYPGAFPITPLGESSSMAVKIWANGVQNYQTSVRLKAFGDAFDLRDTVVTLWDQGSYYLGATTLRFTPQHPGEHFVTLVADDGETTQTLTTVGRGDSVIPHGVFGHLRFHGRSLRYPVYDSSQTDRATFTVLNQSFSNDSLRIDIASLPAGLLLIDSSTSPLAPGQAANYMVLLDSNLPGPVKFPLVIASNADTIVSWPIEIVGYVEEFPKLSLTVYPNSMNGLLRRNKNVLCRNLGERVLYVRLPELAYPFYWEDSVRTLQMHTREYASNMIKFDTTYFGPPLEHRYWLLTNDPLRDSVVVTLKAEGTLNVAKDGLKHNDIVGLKGSHLQIFESEPIQLRITDILGREIYYADRVSGLFDLHQLPKGTYLIETRSHNMVQFVKYQH